jgi:hypothetical protein
MEFSMKAFNLPLIAGLWLPLAAAGQTGPAGTVRLYDGAPNGEIRGTVVDSAGSPVAGAEVTADPVGSGHHLVRWVTADQEGRFVIDGLQWWSYQVRAKKVADGYPDPLSGIFDQSSMQSVGLSPGAPSGSVVIKLGPKAVFITPSYTDAETGQAVRGEARIWVWNNPEEYLHTTRQPKPDLLIPSDKPIGIEFTAAGYEPWRYPSGSGPGQPITLGPGERQTIKVALRRMVQMQKLDSRLLQPSITEEEVLGVVADMFAIAPGDPRTEQEIVQVVKRRGTSTLPIAILGKFLPEPLVSECLDSASPEVRKAALTALYRHGVMVSHLSAKLRAMVSNPNEEPEAQAQARQLLRTVR